MPADLLVLHMKSDAGCLQSIHLSMMASAVPRKRRADLPLCWDLAEDLLQMETGLRRARCCLPESIETVTVVRGGLESGRPSQIRRLQTLRDSSRVIPQRR